MKKDQNQTEIARRRDEGIRRALNTPPKLHKELVGLTERAKDVQILRRTKPVKK